MQSYYIEDLEVGMEAGLEKTVKASDITAFAEITGDRNPVHLSEHYAAKTFFKTRIAHGMLSAGFISAVLGTKLPGPGAIYMSQTLKFLAPVRIGDTVNTVARVTALDLPKKRAQFHCRCEVAGKTVVEGEALVFVPSRAS
ncbi:MAG: MaoC family dehydratase [Proteobacteria bacterium]|nr:MaoC family dehydratase [Pseudomonadota bacterium]